MYVNTTVPIPYPVICLGSMGLFFVFVDIGGDAAAVGKKNSVKITFVGRVQAKIYTRIFF